MLLGKDEGWLATVWSDRQIARPCGHKAQNSSSPTILAVRNSSVGDEVLRQFLVAVERVSGVTYLVALKIGIGRDVDLAVVCSKYRGSLSNL